MHTAPSPAANPRQQAKTALSLGRLKLSAQGIPSWPLECWPLLPLKTASCFRQPHGLPHRAACAPTTVHVCRYCLANPPHHPSQISSFKPVATSNTCRPWEPVSSPVSRQRHRGWPQSPPAREPPTGGRRDSRQRRSTSSGVHPSNHHHIICAHDALFLCCRRRRAGWVVGSRFDSSPHHLHRTRLPATTTTQTSHRRDGAMIGLGSVVPLPLPLTPPSMAWHGRWTSAYIAVPYFIRLVVGSSGMPLS